MKKILFTLVFTLFYLPLCGFSQSDIHTPNKSEPAVFKLAKVYFLPDWSDKGMNFDGTDEKPCTEVCPQKTSYDCASGQTETYTNSCGLTCSRCVECYGCEAKGYTLSGCPENASCLNDCCNNLYKLVSCNNGYVSDGNSCRKETCSDNPNICTGAKTCISGSCQCPNGKTEVGGKCETSTCKNGGITCSGSAGVCNETTGQCVQCMTNSDCGGGKECNANNQCIVPDACASVTCSGGKSCVDGTCVCPSDQVDNNGICEIPNCVNGGVRCDTGETCNTTTKVCEQLCILNPITCKIGDVLYSDKLCYAEKPDCRTAIAVVFDTNKHHAVGLTERQIAWGPSIMPPEGIDIPTLDNLQDFLDIDPYTINPDGKMNTKKLIEFSFQIQGDMNFSSAAGYCYSAYPQEAPGTKTGDWWFPSGAEIKSLGNKIDIVNKTLVSIGGKSININGHYWLSLEINAQAAAAYNFAYDELSAIPKNIENAAFVRPIISY